MNIELIERPRARRTDPSTSHDAADRADRSAKTQAGRILEVFQSCPSMTWTAHELAHATGLTVVQIDRRLPELEQIERTGRVCDGFTVWRVRAG